MQFYIKEKRDLLNPEIKRNDTIKFNCKICKKEVIINRFDKRHMNYYNKMLCHDCNINPKRTKLSVDTDGYIIINSKKDLYNLKGELSKFKFVCRKCGKITYINRFFKNRLKNYSKLTCKACILGYDFKRNMSKDTEVVVDNLNDLSNLYSNQLCTFYCKQCGRKVTFRKESGFGKLAKGRESTLLCQKCNMTNQSKFHREWQEKALNKNRENRGGILNLQEKDFVERNKILRLSHPEWKQKNIESNKKNHNGKYYNSTNEFREFMKVQTKSHPEWQEKALKTAKERYGCSVMQVEEFKNKSFETNRYNHGGKLYIQTEEYKNYMLDKYGSDSIFKSKHFIDLMLKKYGRERAPVFKYNYYGIYFDSKPELAVWIYCIDHNIPIIRNPSRFTYMYNNEKHYYEVDFMINGQLVEIKGDQYIDKETGKWIFPYTKHHHNSDKLSVEEKEYYDNLYEVKRQCALSNGVKILYSSDYQQYVEYINLTYGRKYIDTFKINNPYNPSYWVYYIPYTNNIIKDYYNNSNYNKGIGISPYDINSNDEYTVIGKGISPWEI